MTAAGVGSQDDVTGRAYWARWQVPVCALIILLPAAAAIAVIVRAKKPAAGDRGGSHYAWITCLRGVAPRWLLVYRAAVVVAMATLLCFTVAQDSFFVFYFYTQWTFTLVIIYFVVAALVSAHGCWIDSKKRVLQNEENSRFIKRDLEENGSGAVTADSNRSLDYSRQKEDKRARYIGCAMQVLYQTSAGAVMLTDVVFWGLLVPFQSSDHFRVNLVMALMHSVNLVFLLLETGLNNLTFPFFGITYFILWSCIYVTFQWILHACGFTWWPYPFLELATPSAPLWYLGVALVHLPCYGFYYMVVRAKQSIFPRLFGNAYINSC